MVLLIDPHLEKMGAACRQPLLDQLAQHARRLPLAIARRNQHVAQPVDRQLVVPVVQRHGHCLGMVKRLLLLLDHLLSSMQQAARTERIMERIVSGAAPLLDLAQLLIQVLLFLGELFELLLRLKPPSLRSVEVKRLAADKLARVRSKDQPSLCGVSLLRWRLSQRSRLNHRRVLGGLSVRC